MKKIYSIIAGLLIITSMFAQSPEKMSYQAVVRDGSNQLVTSSTVGMQISILQGTATGTPVYVETQTITSNTNGLVSLEIGSGTVVSGNFTTIDWANGPYFIKTETDPTGGTNYTITGTSQLLSVPYALHAKTAEKIIGNSNFTHYVGEFFGGGIIFHVFKDHNGNEHGLIVSIDDIDDGGHVWSNVTTALNTDRLDGQSNTTAIITQIGHTTSAAKLCDDYTGGGFSDWYLPSYYELDKLMKEILLLNNILENDGNTSSNGFDYSNNAPSWGVYWSSTQSNPDDKAYAWSCYDNNMEWSTTKTEGYPNVRAIRKF